MIARRTCLLGLCTSAPFVATAQMPPRGRLVIGWLTTSPNPMQAPFLDGLRALGYVEGVNLEIRMRIAEGAPERLSEFARELASGGADIIVASGSAAAQAVRFATPDQLALFIGGDPVVNGLVASIARPGGRMTGISLQMEDVAAKWPELLREMLPQARRFAVLADRHNRGNPIQRAAAISTARALGIVILDIDAGSTDEIAPALARARDAGAEGVIVLSSPLFSGRRDDLVAAAARTRLPVIYEHRWFTEAGGLMSYGPDLGAIYRRLAVYADRLARGADPAAMPIEQPTVFQLVLNLGTAKALGLTIPPLLLARADEVIE